MSQQASTQPRIAIAANKGVTAALFSVAIVTYAVRTYIRARMLKKFFADDILLLFAVICLVAVTGLGFSSLQHQYDLLAVILHGADPVLLFSVLDDIPRTSVEENTAATIWWFVIYPVKLAFLFFFRRLIYRVRGLKLWWYFVVVFTVLAGLASLTVSWLTCPYFTIDGVISCSDSDATYRVLRDTGITTAMDIISDVLLISIPVLLLRTVQIKLRQKVGLGISLCLSSVMAVIAVTRMAGAKLDGGTVDIVWLAFWSQQECSIAIIMVSLSAFRSFFIANSSDNSPGKNQASPQWRFKLARKYWNMGDSGESDTHHLPQIPSATLTGMRTMIAEAGADAATWSDKEESDGLPLEP